MDTHGRHDDVDGIRHGKNKKENVKGEKREDRMRAFMGSRLHPEDVQR